MTRRFTFKSKRKLSLWKGCVYTSALLLVCSAEQSFASVNKSDRSLPLAAAAIRQDIIIRGVIRDEAGEALPGAGIRVKGSTISATADAKGNFTIAVPNESAVLVFSYVGYDSQEVVAGTQKNLTITLKETQGTDLDEVAIVAFGTQKKESLVGAQSTVKAAELKQPVANISSMLAGRISGVIGVNRTGEPGSSNADIWIRGISAIGGNSSSPLVIIDGVPNRDLNSLNTYDIESFTILKDAAATAVYGIRGANGVILVTTKAGKEGKPQINVDYFQGLTRFTKLPTLIDGIEYMNLANEATRTESVRSGNPYTPRYTQDYINKTASGEDIYLYPNVDWQDAIFDDFGQNRTATANLSGGVEKAKYYVSLGYYDETGLLTRDKSQSYNNKQQFQRFNVSTNLDWDVTGTTKLSLGVKGILNQGNNPGLENTQGIYNQVFQITPVSYPMLYSNGTVPGISAQSGQRNPYAEVTRRGYRTNYTNQVYSNLRITQDLKDLTPGLSLTGMFSFDAQNNNSVNRNKQESTFRINMTTPFNSDGSYRYDRVLAGQNFLGYSSANSGDKKLYGEVGLTYKRTFGKHDVSGLALYNQSDNLNPFVGSFTLSIPYRLQGLAARATYSYDNKYYVEFNGGYNGSENFAPDKRYGFFPAIGVGYIVSNEEFFKPISNVVQYLKVRYSDGIVGSGGSTNGYVNNDDQRFYYLTKVGTQFNGSAVPGYSFGLGRNGFTGMNVTAYGVDVTWAESRKKDLGVEFRTLKNNLYVIVDLFKEDRTGQFLQRGVVPGYIGLVSSPYGNLGETTNKGIDATLEYTANFGQNVNLSLRANYTYNQAKIIENDQAPTRYPWMDRRGTTPLARFGYIAEGLFTSEAEIAASPTQFGKLLPGDIKYRDLNGDNRIDAFDQAEIGRGDVPSSIYGFGFNLRVKQFDFGAFFQGQGNADVILTGDAIQPFTASAGSSNLHSVVTDRWTVENPRQDAMFPRLSYGANSNNFQQSSWWLRDISYLRLKNAQVGYTFKNGIPTVGLKSLRLYAQAYNVFTISKFKLWDPETASGNGTRYPLTSSYSLGLTASF
ncbi:TonB-dependent receptor [Pedobacter sp. SYP-B3415]|uniref:SusC/RagA family TonB-linked outer membrane protein n=1 Tax=Pedobacter sp. SYP-B3415 TaxID=2496641 RepID=UPI00101C2C9D|nr:TonB-dependent receptor [Pedobacter sp. SYP-B3415]